MVASLQKATAMKLITILFTTSLLTNLTACMVGDEGGGNGQSDGDILYGADDYGDPAVGILRAVKTIDIYGNPTGLGACTATLIAPQVMLTAGHCNMQGLWTDVSFERAPDLFAPVATSWITAAVISNPAYTGDATAGHDVSVVLLSEPVWLAPIRRGPVPAIGSTVTGVGYGANNFDQSGIGSKRTGSFNVTAVAAHEVDAGQEGNNVCHGDSGGPILQNGVQVGVASYVDTSDCHGGGHFMRLDDNLDFIHTYVPSY